MISDPPGTNASNPPDDDPQSDDSRLDDQLDDALEGTFPASDPVSLNTPHPKPKGKDRRDAASPSRKE